MALSRISLGAGDQSPCPERDLPESQPGGILNTPANLRKQDLTWGEGEARDAGGPALSGLVHSEATPGQTGKSRGRWRFPPPARGPSPAPAGRLRPAPPPSLSDLFVWSCLRLLAAPGVLCRRVPQRSGAQTFRRSFFTQLLETSSALGPHGLLAGTPGSRGSGPSAPRPGAGRAWTLGRGRSRGSGTMNGHGVGRAPGYGLNGAGEFYCEAVEGAQNPGGLLLSPAAFINSAQYASVLEGRFKQLQGGLRGWGGGLREEGSGDGRETAGAAGRRGPRGESGWGRGRGAGARPPGWGEHLL